MPPSNTIGAWLDQGDRVTAQCGDCGHSVELDLEALATRLGRDFKSVGNPNPLAARLRCAKCRGKAISLSISPGGTPTIRGR